MLLLTYALLDTMLLIAYSFQNLKLEFDNYTSRKFDNFMKIQVYEWQPFYAIRMEEWNIGSKGENKPF